MAATGCQFLRIQSMDIQEVIIAFFRERVILTNPTGVVDWESTLSQDKILLKHYTLK